MLARKPTPKQGYVSTVRVTTISAESIRLSDDDYDDDADGDLVLACELANEPPSALLWHWSMCGAK